jgi:HEPN domain-containing protein
MATSVDLARQLLGAAVNDELMARSLLPVEGVTDAGIGYHAQQAVEKAIKAVLAAKGTRFAFSHNLDYLRDLCKESGIALPSTLVAWLLDEDLTQGGVLGGVLGMVLGASLAILQSGGIYS